MIVYLLITLIIRIRKEDFFFSKEDKVTIRIMSSLKNIERV